MQQSNKKLQKPVIDNSYINLGEILHACLVRWYWFVFSLLIALGVALYRIATTKPTYTRYCEVLIKSKDKSSSIGEQMANMANMGLHNNTNAYNEIYTFRSQEIIRETAQILNLKMEYICDGTFHSETLYGESLPATVELYDLSEEATSSLTMQITPEGEFTLSNFIDSTGTASNTPISGTLVDGIALVESPVGKIIVRSNPYCHTIEARTINVRQIGIENAAARLLGNLSFNLQSEESGIIVISARNHSIDQADDILRTLIDVYSRNWVKDKNKTAEGTLQFIDERLANISDELNEVDNNISSYKSRNLLPDIAATTSMHISKNRDNINKLQKLNNDLAIARDTYKALLASKPGQSLPLGASLGSSSLNNQIVEYNQRLMERNEQAQKSGESNPYIKELDLGLTANREAIIAAARTIIKKTETEISTLEKDTKKTIAEISKNPEQTKYLASAEREQSVKEKLYLFLLQKREENQLSQAFTAYKTRVITPPTGSIEPTAPIKKDMLLMAIAIGLLIPGAIILIKEISNTRVRGRKDLDGLSAPIIGEIPQLHSGNKRHGLFARNKKDNKISVVVQDGNRNIINEAFRVLRTNIEFITRGKEQSTIISTSFNPGSGKTFCMINIATSLAIKGEKVIVIDGDMRHASLSHHVGNPSQGISNYLAGEVSDIKEVIVTDSRYPSLHVLPVGTIPPNPTELLEQPRFATLMATLKKEYKYILIDCPPIEMIADTHIIEKHADRTFFLVRAGIMERAMLPEIENIYKENKLKNISIIINGVPTEGSRYGYKYSYRYGYHASYHYGNK